ncbi:hypothetical protein MUK42_07344 [Musa troglodytarum]|uniref:DEUBAD domain-containing protein n=1 Tax=Musa troglodytarum TaxID=320322 RepID=A0A9E7KPD8_9LILI|nr:hypothetical protein MUK42_07344 [Musa troglodytarum]
MRSLRSHTWLTRETGPTANLQSTRSHAAAESDELTPPTKQPISPSLEIPNPEGRVGSPRSLLFLLRPLRPFERMAAGQQKKRLTSSNFHEQYKGKKKKKLDSSDYILNLRCRVDLAWDDCQRTVVAKKEQISLSWTDIAPFLDSVSQSHSGLADVVSVPIEIFSLDNLTDVLSYEVWATCLSESERKLLTQFLPSVKGAEQVVHSLLKGENHHFGNPSLEWQVDFLSTSLCAGNLHPDILLQMEEQCQLSKRAYYCEINKYHKGMLEVLKKWKERWLNCKDPELLLSEGYSENKEGSLANSAERANVLAISKRESPHKVCDHAGDTDKYMSYIKVSRAQHQLIKNIKHSADGIQPKLLGRVLGDIQCFHVHPYETFEEEEKQRLHEHWLVIISLMVSLMSESYWILKMKPRANRLQVANKDLLVAFEAARGRKLWREQSWKSLERELAEKMKFINDKDDKIESSEGSPEEPTYDRYHRNQHAQDINDKNYGESKDNSIDDHQLELIPPLNSHKEPSLIVHNQEETLQQDDDFSPLSHSVEKQNPKNMWQTAGVSDSYYHSSENHGYTSASELSLRQPQLTMEHPTNMIDLERDIIESEGAEPIPSAFDVDGRASLFCSFGRNEMLPTFPKEPRVMSSYPEHINGMKQAGLQFLMANDDLQESSLVSNQLQEQQQLIEQRDAREKEVYMQQIIPKKVYSTARYPNQGFPSVDRQNLAAVQSSMNSGTRGYNWFPGDDQSYGSWSAVESSRGGGQCLDDGGSADGSLYSVLSNKLSTCSPYDSNSSEQYLQPRSFVGTAIPSAHNIYGYGQHQPDNPSSHQIGVTPSMNNGSWMNFPPQNSELHDPLGRPFQRPWDHQ